METNDEKWFRFVHHKPLGTYEIDPALTKTAVDGASGQPVILYVIDMPLMFHSCPMH